MLIRCVTLFVLILTFSIAHAQTVTLNGKVSNQKNEPLVGASVNLTGGGGTTTDLEGRFAFSLAIGTTHEIVISAVGYGTKTIADVTVKSGEANELNVVLEIAAKDLSTVTVTSTRSNARRETVASVIQFQKNTNTVASVVSAESIRRSPDRNTGEVLKRIPGTSIQDGRYIIVRGLADRYNQAMLNGILLASTEPDRKTFTFDLFPAQMVDNIIVNKAFVPELPGEWAGGLIQVNTKDIPSAGFLNVQVGTGFNTETIGKDFYKYQGGKYDWLGFDDRTRALPDNLPTKNKWGSALVSKAERTEWGKQFRNIWTAEAGKAPLNAAFQVNGGFNTRLFGKKVGGILALNYARSNRNLDFNNASYNITGGKADYSFDYHNNRYSQDVLWGALGNITIQLNNNNKISFKNLLNVNASDYTTLRTGLDKELDANLGENIRANELAFRSNIYYNTQLIGEHNFSGLGMRGKWYGGFTILDQYIPDQRRIQYNQRQDVPNAPFKLLAADVLSQKSGSRFYSSLNDYVYSAGGDLTKTFTAFGFKQTAKAGYVLQIRDRLFDSRPFAIPLPRTDDSNLDLVTQDESTIYSPENFDANDEYKFQFDEISGNRFRYMANTILNAGYLQLDNQFSEMIRLVWGARLEHYDQLVGSVRKSDDRHVYNKVLDVLPGVNLTLKLNNTSNFRLSGSQTVIRPELRELSAFAFYDFELGATVIGNPSLKRTKITNADLRYEIYPRAGEVFTAGVFYKHFKNPIELYFNQSGAGTSSTFNYLNAEKATGYGIELEGRKKLDFSNALRNFTFSGNLSYIHNRVEDATSSIDRPMQGQSPYLVNLGLQYDLEKAGITTTLLFNQIGRRIVYVGNNEYPAIWENPRPLLDFQITKKLLNNKAEIKLNVSDIINKRAYFYHDLDVNNDFKKGTDAIAINRLYGTGIGLSFHYNFK